MHPTSPRQHHAFLASLEPENAPSPPHRLQSGRPAPDLERDLAAEASRVWHEPVARVEASRDRTREAERKVETTRRSCRSGAGSPAWGRAVRVLPRAPQGRGSGVLPGMRGREVYREPGRATAAKADGSPGANARAAEEARRRRPLLRGPAVCNDYMRRSSGRTRGSVLLQVRSTNVYELSTRPLLKCRDCKKQFSYKVGTIFEDSPLGLDKWFPAVWCIANAKNGISSHELGRALASRRKPRGSCSTASARRCARARSGSWPAPWRVTRRSSAAKPATCTSGSARSASGPGRGRQADRPRAAGARRGSAGQGRPIDRARRHSPDHRQQRGEGREPLHRRGPVLRRARPRTSSTKRSTTPKST
jgi:hypothetical protein